MKVTDEMVQTFGQAWHAEDEKGTHLPGARRRAGIAAVLAIVERDQPRPKRSTAEVMTDAAGEQGPRA